MASIINAATSGGLVTSADTSGILQLQTASTTAVTVNASQNVGIGTTSPAYKLHVVKPSAGLTARFTDGDGITDVYGYGLEITRSVAYIKGSGALHLGSSAGYNGIVIDSAGNSTLSGNISVGGATVTTSGTGITFPATQSASSNANTLDDYEEGTWTPTIGGGYTGVTYSVQNGRYTKVGRLVTLTCYLQFSGTFDTTNIIVGSLPFDLSISYGGNAGTVGYWDVTTDGNLSAWISGSTTVQFYKIGTSGAAGSIGNVSGKYIVFSITGSI